MNIPQGHQAVMPYLILNGAARFIDFVKAVFQAEIVNITYQKDPEDRIMHAEALIGGSTVMFTDATTQWTPQVVGLFVYVDDADVSFDKAVAAGAKVIMGLSDQSYGRTCGVEDPTGNTWWITAVAK